MTQAETLAKMAATGFVGATLVGNKYEIAFAVPDTDAEGKTIPATVSRSAFEAKYRAVSDEERKRSGGNGWLKK